ncbi:ABC transporter transmembrane domain-containing protein [Thorsellia anophelis]|uniref:ATP-binding cassette, subfamily B n=1 Tax=Thorsellia anophelis DSM 18579 TaxID=1123402 RepID=A0A1I0DRP2_9GAMM|nr:ABC transporter transmembrane domain-containing protein [Thorsellia anophelis]SET35252.1 ATP-binding cassette, subfamily B [Thorsellia anophelis DSM 18579]
MTTELEINKSKDVVKKNNRFTSSFTLFKQLAPLLRQERKLLIAWLVALAASSTATLMIPAAMKQMIDKGFTASTEINEAFVGLFIVALFLATATALRFLFVSLLGERVVMGLRKTLYAHLIKLDLAFHHQNQSGELVSRLSADSELIRSVIGSSMSVALRSLVTFIGSITLMVITQPKLAAIALLSLPIAILPILLGAKKIRKKAKNNQDEVAEANLHAAETLSSIYTVQAFTKEEIEIKQFGISLNHTYQAAKARISAQSLITALAITLVFGAIVFVLWLGAHDVVAGNLSAGSLGQFVMYALLAGTSIGSLSEMFNELQRATGGMQRISHLLAQTNSLQEEGKYTSITQETADLLVLESISFAYPIYPDRQVLKNISITIKLGETVALVGPSGGGKSSLFNLLMRFYDPTDGRILLGGHPLAQWQLHALRNQFAVVPQKPDLFAASVRDNIAYGDQTASFSAIENAAKEAEAIEFINQLPNQFETLVGERGAQLSGGQQQRIAIARAMLKNAPILLLDEATSALDAQSEYFVQQGLERLMAGKTTIIIAHRLSTVLKADRIIVIDKGEIIEQGNHESLMQKKGLYAEFARLQLM